MNLGLSFDDFWAVTPAEFNRLAEAFRKKRELEIDVAKASAYWVESLARTKRLPEFSSWMKPPRPARTLKGKELEDRHREHEEDVERWKSLRDSKPSDTSGDGGLDG